MKVAQKISEKIAGIPYGNTFGYQELPIARNEYSAAAKAIERLVKSGVISRASIGLFYKPQKTVFGILKPSEQELLKPYLFLNNERMAYITGNALYNRMGLTTQVSKNLKIASRDKTIAIKLGDIKVTSIKSNVDVNNKNYTFLEILDAIKDFKIIPDLNAQSAIKVITTHIEKIENMQLFVKLALAYPPRVKALVGAILDLLGNKVYLDIIKQNLNPLSRFNYGLTKNQLPTIANWNIY